MEHGRWQNNDLPRCPSPNFLHTGDIIISDDVTLHNERPFVDMMKVDNVEMERVS